jgi:hypothetical protein
LETNGATSDSLPPIGIPSLNPRRVYIGLLPKVPEKQAPRKSAHVKRMSLFRSDSEDQATWNRLEKILTSDGYPGYTLGKFSSASQPVKDFRGSFDAILGGIFQKIQD